MSIIGAASHGLTAIVCVSFDHRAPVDGLREFKHCLRKCPQIEASLEASGTFDLILQVSLEDLAAYNAQIDRLAKEIGTYVRRFETSFVCGMTAKPDPGMCGEACWVKDGDGYRRLDPCDIDRITAERDYIRFHVGGASYLHHGTIHEILERLHPDLFVQLHRSAIVRKDHIIRFMRVDRSWRALLRDGTVQSISRRHVPDLLKMIERDSSKQQHHSSKAMPHIESPVPAIEN